MNVIYDRIKKGFNACSCLSGSWWVDSGVVATQHAAFLESRVGGHGPIIQIKSYTNPLYR